MEWKEAAARHLSARDPVMATLVKHHGLFEHELRTDYYFALVSSIIGQQLSVKAAASIRQRFLDLFDGKFPTPEQILQTDPETMRGIGFSYAKVKYVQDLALHVLDGRLHIGKLPELSNEEIISELVAVKGIGEWTAHMFLIFALGRPDILPVGDLGVRNGIQRLYGFEELPTADEIRQLADEKDWHPYESAVAWYVWRSLDNEPE